MTDYAAIIRNRRRELGLLQREVAARAHIHRATLSFYENNKVPMNLDVFLTILQVLGLKMVVLEEWEGNA